MSIEHTPSLRNKTILSLADEDCREGVRIKDVTLNSARTHRCGEIAAGSSGSSTNRQTHVQTVRV
jgi:hypothetical protein